MTTITEAFAAIKARAIATVSGPALAWQDEDNLLPDAPADIVYFEMVTEGGGFLEMGGGRGSNRHRHRAELMAYVLFPRGKGLAYGLSVAEPVAAAFRSWRASGVSFQGATVHPSGEEEPLVPPGVASAAGNYACVTVVAPFTFDQTA